MERTKTGVIGVGRLGKMHAKIYQELPDTLLLGIYDKNIERAQEAAKELGVIAFDSIEGLIAEVDALSIAIPPAAHFEVARKLLEQGKHVLIEQPIANSEQVAQQLIDLANKNACRLMIGHVERFNAAINTLEDIPLKPMFIETDRQASFKSEGENVSVIMDLMLHDIDLAFHLTSSKAIKVEANGAAVISDDIDIANARIEFENGCVASLTASRLSTKKIAKMRLYQKDAQINLDFVEGASEIFYLTTDTHTPFHDGTLALSLGKFRNREIKYNRLKRDQVNPLKNELRSFIVSIRNNLPMAISGENGLAALNVAYQVQEKIKHQRQKFSNGI